MTEFNSVQEIEKAIAEVKQKLAKLRRALMDAAKHNRDNSTELQDKKDILKGLEHLQSLNKKAFKNVSTDDERQGLVDRARHLALEIATMEKQIADFDKPAKDFEKQEFALLDELHKLEREKKTLALEKDLEKAVVRASNLDKVLEDIEGVFNMAFNYRGAFEGHSFVTDSFAQNFIKDILSDKFDEKQVEILVGIAARRTDSFIAAYAELDDEFDETVGAYFNILRAQIEVLEAFDN